jgi:two-component sensor histidine kinase
MIKTVILVIGWLLAFGPIYGQWRISRQEADSLLGLLRHSPADTVRINLLLKLGEFHISKPGEFKMDLDSAAGFIEQAKRLNDRIQSGEAAGKICLIEAFLCKERGQRNEGEQLTDKAILLLKDSHNMFFLGRAYMEKSDYYDYRNSTQFSDKIRLVENAVSCFQESGNIERLAYSRQFLGDLYNLNGETAKALKVLELSLHDYKSIHYNYLVDIYTELGIDYISQRDYTRSLNCELMALRNAADVHDTSSLRVCEINNAIGMVYMDLNEKEKAIAHFQYALKIAVDKNSYEDVAEVSAGLADCYLHFQETSEALAVLDRVSGRLAQSTDPYVKFYLTTGYLDIYISAKRYHQARHYANYLLGLMQQTEFINHNTGYAYELLIRFYLGAGQYSSALGYLVKNQALNRKVADPIRLRDNYQFWFILDTAQRHYPLAVEHLLQYNRLNDSIFNETKSRQIQELEVAYETSEKEKRIQSLKDEEKLESHALAQSNQSRNFYSAGVLLLLLLLGAGYSRFRLKQHKNRQLEAKQKEISAKNTELELLLHENEWLLREVHHRVKNNLQIVMSLLNSQSAYLTDEVALNAVFESQHRVQTMSLIHQKLYKSNNVSSIYMPEYINDLVDYLKDSFKTGQTIYFDLQLALISLDVLQAVPVGLILNEMITNAIKYAFPHTEEDRITITLSRSGSDIISLVVADNGRGLPPGFDREQNSSFGMVLLKGLTEDLGGEYSIESHNGTSIRMVFKNIHAYRNELQSIT